MIALKQDLVTITITILEQMANKEAVLTASPICRNRRIKGSKFSTTMAENKIIVGNSTDT